MELVPAGATPLTASFDASRHVVLPGLVNAHHHFYQTLTRAFPPALNKPLFGWLTTLYPVWSRLTPENHRLATRLALVELLLSGCTTAPDHHYVYPTGLDAAVGFRRRKPRHSASGSCRGAARWSRPLGCCGRLRLIWRRV